MTKDDDTFEEFIRLRKHNSTLEEFKRSQGKSEAPVESIRPPTGDDREYREFQEYQEWKRRKGTQTIEQTGKQFNALILVGVLLILFGIPVWAISFPAGALMVIVGIVVYAMGRVGGWWHHG